jgi:hypothetical protein
LQTNFASPQSAVVNPPIFVPADIQNLIMVLCDIKDGLGSIWPWGIGTAAYSCKTSRTIWRYLANLSIDQELVGSLSHCLGVNF